MNDNPYKLPFEYSWKEIFKTYIFRIFLFLAPLLTLFGFSTAFVYRGDDRLHVNATASHNVATIFATLCIISAVSQCIDLCFRYFLSSSLKISFKLDDIPIKSEHKDSKKTDIEKTKVDENN